MTGLQLPLVLSLLAVHTLAASIASRAIARTWIVYEDGTGDAPTIQAAIDSARTGDDILLTTGHYTWSNQGGGRDTPAGPSMIVMKSGVALRGATTASSTVLDAQASGRVIACLNVSNAAIDGLTIRGGNAQDPDNEHPPTGLGSGAGILCRSSFSIQVVRCILSDNVARYLGGGIANDHSITTIQSNSIYSNSSLSGGGGVSTTGGTSHPLIESNTIVGNVGGGVFCGEGGATISRNVIVGNLDIPGMSWGAFAIACAFATPTVSCNDLWGHLNDSFCGIDGGDNFSLDPQFCSSNAPDDGNFGLQSDSPCLAENNSCGQDVGAAPVACESVGIAGTTWGRLKRTYAR